MLTSMTGFGRAERTLTPSGRAVVEIRAVNHRFLEIEIRLPEGFQILEEEIRAQVARQLQRGQVRVSASLKASELVSPIEFNLQQARRYMKQLRQMERALGMRNSVTLEQVLSLPQVVKVAEKTHPSDRHRRAIQQAVEQALDRLVQMRRQEGARLQRALLTEIGSFQRWVAKIRRKAPRIHRQAQRRLAKRIGQLLRGTPAHAISSASVLAEAGVLAQAADVSEELARIDSHIRAMTRVAHGEATGPSRKPFSAGRTMDFLAQELQREVNTLGTKLRDPTVVQYVVAMKGQIEKLKEQAANLE